jgi:hypothetical protein
MHPMMDPGLLYPELVEQRREEIWREVEMDHLAKIVRATRKTRAGTWARSHDVGSARESEHDIADQ